jgi:hypothetical protein
VLTAITFTFLDVMSLAQRSDDIWSFGHTKASLAAWFCTFFDFGFYELTLYDTNEFESTNRKCSLRSIAKKHITNKKRHCIVFVRHGPEGDTIDM